jgi:hypothetical protein
LAGGPGDGVLGLMAGGILQGLEHMLRDFVRADICVGIERVGGKLKVLHAWAIIGCRRVLFCKGI